jgi:hypothetical protein
LLPHLAVDLDGVVVELLRERVENEPRLGHVFSWAS